MSRPTHVMVCRYVQRDGDLVREDWPMPLEEFAALFEWGEEHGFSRKGRTVDHVIRVRDDDDD